MHRVIDEPAFVLRSQKYSETSLLLDVYCQNLGRLRGIAKGVKKSKSNYSAWQPFCVCKISISGNSELKNLRLVDQDLSLLNRADRLIFGMYLNEILFLLTPELDAHKRLFHAYLDTISKLNIAEEIDEILRKFELYFLQESGFELDFCHDNNTNPICESRLYRFSVESGLTPAESGNASDVESCVEIPGEDLLQIAIGNFSQQQLKLLKRICRQYIDHMLDGRELNSRKLYKQLAL